MKIKILGTGCAKCHQLEQSVKEVLKEMQVEASVEDVRDIKKILEYPILMTPGLVIDEKLVLSGKVPDKKELSRYISDAQISTGE